MNEDIKGLKYDENLLYKFVVLYSDFINKPKDYGTGELINMMEVHTLTIIEENPGITAKELCKMWNRTKGAVSQTISKLEKKGYIYKEKKIDDAKFNLLYPTEKGITLSLAHKEYDKNDIIETFDYLLTKCDIEEMNTFYKVLDVFIGLFESENEE